MNDDQPDRSIDVTDLFNALLGTIALAREPHLLASRIVHAAALAANENRDLRYQHVSVHCYDRSAEPAEYQVIRAVPILAGELKTTR